MVRRMLYDAKAEILGNKNYPNVKGKVYFKETREGVFVTAEIWNLPTSIDKCQNKVFGFHIHSGEECTGNSSDYFANAKMHYNPKNCSHPQHAGDLPPLFENNGYAYMSFLTNRFKIKEIIGKTIIIHSNPDDFTTGPSGNSGEKIACGVIKNI